MSHKPKRWTDHRYIEKQIDLCHEKADKAEKEADALEVALQPEAKLLNDVGVALLTAKGEQLDALNKQRTELSENVAFKRKEITRLRQYANNQREGKAPRIGKKLAEFKTGLLFGKDESVKAI